MGTSRSSVALSLVTMIHLLNGCAPLPRGDGAEAGVHRERGALVLDDAALHDGRGSLLDAMRGKIPSFHLRLTTGQCPVISVRRGAGALGHVGSPSIYVDGTHATDTCILQSLRAVDTQRVEVYPMGFTTRPGYGTESNGLILVFMRSR